MWKSRSANWCRGKHKMSTEITSEFVWHNIPPRPRDSHKGSFGTVLAVAGSAYYRGAALLAAEGALRTGAGIVTLASVEPVLAAAVCPPAGVLPVPCVAGAEGGISPENSAAPAAEGHRTAAWPRPWRHSAKHRPGRRDTHAGAEAAARLCRQRGAGRRRPERRRAAAGRGQALPHPAGELVVTPHPGEMARLPAFRQQSLPPTGRVSPCSMPRRGMPWWC